MPIGVRCRECGREFSVEDSFAGSEVDCFICGSPLVVPGDRPSSRRCIVCNQDVSSAQRVKDPQGNYYCPRCYEASAAAYKAVPPQVRAALSTAALSVAAEARKTGRERSEFGALVTGFFNVRRSGRVKLGAALVVVGWAAGGWFAAEAAVVLAASLAVLGGALLLFRILWPVGAPFRDGTAVGMACLKDGHRRGRWLYANPEFRLRSPGRLLVLALLMLLLAAGAFYIPVLAARAARPAPAAGR